MYDLRWYQALALWKSAVFLEGNYKRFVQGASDDEFYRLMEHGIPELARDHQATRPGHVKGLLVDFGGVLTTDVFESFRAFCEREGLDPNEVIRLFRIR